MLGQASVVFPACLSWTLLGVGELTTCWCRLALHVMCFSNARAIAGLWQRFVRYLREGCWDQGRLLPRMAPARHHQSRQQDSAVPAVSAARAEADGNALPRPDFSCCVLHQKLQMLNLCIQQAHGLQPV